MKVKVQKYKGERALQRGVQKMLDDGWTVQTQQSRKRIWRPTTGIFTKQQVHTVTFVKPDPGEELPEADS